MCDRDIVVRALGCDEERMNYGLSAHLCDENKCLEGVVTKI